MKVALAQIAPVLLDREKTLSRVVENIHAAADDAARLVAFGEALVPGYPFWVERTDGARFDSALQKRWHAAYQENAVCIESGDLDAVCQAARDRQIAVYLGVMERPTSRGGHSLYATLAYIAPTGDIESTHRKLMPTYEERLVWATGDGHGLRVHSLDDFIVGGLNCWENWMPLPRAALYAQGETLHVAVWPGNLHNTAEITRFIARESRSYVLSVSGLMRPQDLPAELAEDLALDIDETWANGGSCLAGPDGQWVIEPVTDVACVQVADIDAAFVRRERHNFDPSGHYSRPDVTSLLVNRERQAVAQFIDSSEDDNSL